MNDRALPEALAAAHAVEFDYDEGNGVDYEPYDEFATAEDTADWIRAWTGNTALTGAEFRVFGQDGTGGYAAFWLVRPDAELTAQPVVFLGSEGEKGVVAADLGAFLWLLADGSGPMEAVEYPSQESRPNAELRAVAQAHASASPHRRAEDVIAAARAEFPGFAGMIDGWCRFEPLTSEA
ncbi:SMI1/KNR4 family protein [Actinosynnema sp. NPDC020468]|uniref:SMI1/KNR4 family protein n=1 Tax=Actinosynnema sp. NPDC020468 TaxID=3154488 RepID=UPI0033C1C65A